MEYKIGKQFKFKDKTIEVIESQYIECDMCYFKRHSLKFCLKIMCAKSERLDGKYVYFKEVKNENWID